MSGSHPADRASPAMPARVPSDASATRSPPFGDRLPRNLNWLWAAGPTAGLMLLVVALTGAALLMHYVPSAAAAFASVERIDRSVGSGWLLRAVHAGGTSLLFVCLYVQLFTALYYGSYKRPRVGGWIGFVLLLLLCLTVAVLGATLPWNQPGYWSLLGVAAALREVPGIGRSLCLLLLGASSSQPQTLTRLSALHALLGVVLLGLGLAHVSRLRRTGPNNPLGLEVRSGRDTLPLHPYYTLRFGLVACLACLLLASIVFFGPGLLFGPESWRAASTLAPPPDLSPAWYVAPFHAVVHATPAPRAGVVLALGMGLVLLAAPWLDTSPVRSGRFRPRYRIGMAALVLCALTLLQAGLHPAAGAWRLPARIAILYWFAHFLLLLPWLGRTERAAALPAGISRPILPQRPEPRPLDVVYGERAERPAEQV